MSPNCFSCVQFIEATEKEDLAYFGQYGANGRQIVYSNIYGPKKKCHNKLNRQRYVNIYVKDGDVCSMVIVICLTAPVGQDV